MCCPSMLPILRTSARVNAAQTHRRPMHEAARRAHHRACLSNLPTTLLHQEQRDVRPLLHATQFHGLTHMQYSPVIPQRCSSKHGWHLPCPQNGSCITVPGNLGERSSPDPIDVEGKYYSLPCLDGHETDTVMYEDVCGAWTNRLTKRRTHGWKASRIVMTTITWNGCSTATNLWRVLFIGEVVL